MNFEPYYTPVRGKYTPAERDDMFDMIVAGHGITPNVGKGRNLLDNSCFAGGGSQQGGGQFPINQRGMTSYTTGYGIDRWTTGYGVQLVSSGIKLVLSGLGTYAGVAQNIDAFVSGWLKGKTVTMSAIFNGELISGTWTIPTTAFPVDGYVVPPVAGTNGWIQLYSPDGVHISAGCFTQTSDTVVPAVKLELGDTQTFAHQENGVWVLNDTWNYGEELAKCQRYQIKLKEYTKCVALREFDSSTLTTMFIPLPVSPRASGVTVGDITGALAGNGAIIYNVTIPSGTRVSARENGVAIDIPGETRTTPDEVYIFNPSTPMLLDFNL